MSIKELVEQKIADYLNEGSQNSYDKYSHCHGPLMNASSWIGKQSLEKLVDHPQLNPISTGHKHDVGFHVGHITDDSGNKRHVALLTHGKPEEKHISSGYKHSEVGYNKPHAWYQDTGRGYRHGGGSLTITGHVHVHPDGKVETHGDVDMKKSHNLMVYK